MATSAPNWKYKLPTNKIPLQNKTLVVSMKLKMLINIMNTFSLMVPNNKTFVNPC